MLDIQGNAWYVVIALIVLLVICAVGWIWCASKSSFTTSASSPHVSPFGNCYSGHLGWQPNAGSNAGHAIKAANPAACADVCDSREGCTGYKYRHSDGGCFPIQVGKADFSAKLARAEGWSSAVKCSAA